MNSDNNDTVTPVYPDYHQLLKLAQATMPYGKYAGRHLVDLPESYVVWLSHKGFPRANWVICSARCMRLKQTGLNISLSR